MRAFASKVVRSLGCLRLRSGSLPAWRISGTAMTVLMLSFFSQSAAAVTVTVTNIWPAGQTPTLVTNINGPADAQQTSFTGYVAGPCNYVLVPFKVDVSGVYTATSTTTNVLNTTWFLNGLFSPSNTAPSTPLSNFIVAVLAVNGTPKTGTFTGVSLTAGQQYSVLVAFNTGSTSGDLSTITITGPGCIAIGANVCSSAVPGLSPFGLVLLVLTIGLLALWQFRGRTFRRG